MSLFKRHTSRDEKSDDILRDDAKPKALNAWQKGFETLRFDKHRRLERRIVYTGAAFFVLILGVGWSHHHKVHEDYLQSQKLTTFNSAVSFSQTSSVTMTLQKLHISKDGKTAFVPFTFSNLDSISANANNYYVIVLPASGKLQYYPSGQLIFFGTSGRGVIELHNEGGFQSQPLKVLIRNDKNLSGSDNDANSDISDSSNSVIAAVEAKYDMLDFTINPGGSDAQKSKVDVNSSNNPTELYNALFASQDIDKINQANKSNEKQIAHDKALITEYRQRLTTMGFKVPDDPKWMNDNWKPYDYIQDDGVPYNLRGKRTAEQALQSAIDGTSLVNNNNDSSTDPDAVSFPGVLKRADGTTTDDYSTANAPVGGNGTTNSGTGADSINGNSDSPATLWANLQSTWQDVKTAKRNIYSTNAATLFQIKAFGLQQQQLASIGSKKHFKVVDNDE